MHYGHVASLVAVLAVCLLRAAPVTSSVTIGLDLHSIRGPGHANVDLAASKRTHLPGRVSLDARLEVFSVFNRFNFIKVNDVYGEGPAPVSTFLAPVAGITNVDPARQIQFAFK